MFPLVIQLRGLLPLCFERLGSPHTFVLYHITNRANLHPINGEKLRQYFRPAQSHSYDPQSYRIARLEVDADHRAAPARSRYALLIHVCGGKSSRYLSRRQSDARRCHYLQQIASRHPRLFCFERFLHTHPLKMLPTRNRTSLNSITRSILSWPGSWPRIRRNDTPLLRLFVRDSFGVGSAL